ncbi:hypothetical protein GCM10012287_16600 [Streptomyces daqingensis]|uniref:Uncharacterized protein n=1 Tax=Streptomyces daqingensis TaxID=1472640 RepID=A0ABQ2M3F6_9ACTN|nr:hypothetical protein GCM10012287_16600 [Streptomyces daqingensis]
MRPELSTACGFSPPVRRFSTRCYAGRPVPFGCAGRPQLVVGPPRGGCARSEAGGAVPVRDAATPLRSISFHADYGWNRADAVLIVAEPVKHGLLKVRGWRFGSFSPTKAGWEEYRRNFMWSERSEAVHISASSGGFVVANVSSPHGYCSGRRQQQRRHARLPAKTRRGAEGGRAQC